MAKSETLQNAPEEKARLLNPSTWFTKRWTFGEIAKIVAAGVGVSLLVAAA